MVTERLSSFFTLADSVGTDSLGADHVLGPDDAVEFLAVDEAGLDGLFAQGRAVLVGGLGDFGGVVVADFRRQRRDQHQRAAHQFVDLLAVGLDAGHAMIGEAAARRRR